MKRFIIGILVENKAGVLTRVSGMFSRRAFNIDSLTVGETETPDYSRMTVTMTGSDYDRDQMIKQLNKIQEVREIREMDSDECVMRELIMMKVSCDMNNRQDVMNCINVFRAKIIDFAPNSLCLEMTGESAKLSAFIDLMKPYGIIEMCRTGVISMDRGLASLKN